MVALDDIPPCAGCGRCCHWVVVLRPEDHVPDVYVVEREGERCMDQRGDGACVALDPATRLCTLYDQRPLTCREFARGEALCRQVLGRVNASPDAGRDATRSPAKPAVDTPPAPLQATVPPAPRP
ncbi:MAG: YkgJ family cysteine cluster protein [Opitutaceae bacterium]|nr:YkgJ family cysteine cluster protein [Opitutaceae bacterium]